LGMMAAAAVSSDIMASSVQSAFLRVSGVMLLKAGATEGLISDANTTDDDDDDDDDEEEEEGR